MTASTTAAPHHPLVVVSNRQPYQHFRTADGGIEWSPTTGGVAVALDALMRERGGVWIAHGAGNGDRDVVDANDRILVPPDSPAYPLRRLWLTEEESNRYYEGFANEGLWPLCHEAHVRPVFRAADWATYQQVNERFAAVHRRGVARPGRAGVHPGLPPGAGGAGLAGALPGCPGRRCSGTSRGPTRTGCASARGAASCWRGCSPTTCWPSSSNATGATSSPPRAMSSVRTWAATPCASAAA